MADTKNVHEGHRDRLRNKFLENGFQGFDPHNILELLLFYSIPRKDTNEIAHNLLNHFGSLKYVFEADYNELVKVNGISKNSATLIKMIPKIFQEYMNDCLKENTVFDTADKIGRFFVNKYLGEKIEIVYAMLLNNKFELLDLVKVEEGSVNHANIPSRKIVDAVVRTNAAMVVIAHNHPDGLACPSHDDITATANLMGLFKSLDVHILEHFIIAGTSYFPLVFNTRSLQVHFGDENKLYNQIQS